LIATGIQADTAKRTRDDPAALDRGDSQYHVGQMMSEKAGCACTQALHMVERHRLTDYEATRKHDSAAAERISAAAR